MPIVLITNPSTGAGRGALLDAATILDHAFRRCKVHPGQQTPETVAIAKESLYLLLLNLANRGLNLWCVESNLIGLQASRGLYAMDDGTIDVLNVVYSQPTRVTGTDTVAATSINTELDEATAIKRIGLKFSTIAASEQLLVTTSTDGVTWTTQLTETRDDWEAGTWYWLDLPLTAAGLHYRVAATAAITTTEFYLASALHDLPVVQWNRDTWATIPDKTKVGRPSTNYYLERSLTPQLTLWPVPNNDYDHLQVFVQRQVAEIGALSDTIEVPDRWVEAIIWQLAARLAFEVPQVPDERIPLVLQSAAAALLDVERAESDGAPIMLSPNIGVYSV